jgi:hypothetical protein
MAGICWRLLAVVSLIFAYPIFFASLFFASILAAPTLLRGQDASGDRSPVLATATSPILTPSHPTSPVAPVWIPPPRLPNPRPIDPIDARFERRFFAQLVRSAGIIFSGRVTSIGRSRSSGGESPDSTAVTFQVERAMRGASPGQKLTIREWAGLWSSGERYRVGEHVLLFLYSPSKLGLTSPVAGALGRFAVDSQGRIQMNEQHVATLASDPVLGGKTVVPYAVFVQAVQRSSGEE